MNRTDWLLAIILELQDRKQLRAEDLAAIFEVNNDPRKSAAAGGGNL
jgi:hypothetical protein